MEIDARYERKFRVEATEASFLEIQHAVRAHPLLFRPAYPDRLVGSLYLDTPDLQAFWANAAGLAERAKPRLRWYGPLAAPTGARLEIKRRHGLVGTKELLPLPDGLPPGLVGRPAAAAWRAFAAGHPWLRQFPELAPTALVTYRRSYMVSADGRLRLTLDRELRYAAPGAPPAHAIADGAVIIELKYPVAGAEGGLFGFPFRPTRNSKYVVAMLNLQ